MVIEQLVADRERGESGDAEATELLLRADTAPEQDRGREVGARRQHDGVGLDLLFRDGHDARRAVAVEHHAVDERVAEDDEVRPLPRAVEVREGRVPAPPVDDVRRKPSAPDGL